MEIERKFLIAAEPDLGAATSVAVRQGYVTRPGDSVSVRLRQKGEKFLLTVKSGQGLVREEHESRIEPGLFERFWPATEGRRVEKTRWTGALPGGETFEYDVFAGAHAPLRLVEVEFGSREAAEAFSPPDWFGAEVTGERGYSNEVLAVEGLPETPRDT